MSSYKEYASKEELPGVMTGATADAAGTSGLVPAPAKGDQDKFLQADGTWKTPTDTTYNVATESADGLMSAADKVKVGTIDKKLATSGGTMTGTLKAQANTNYTTYQVRNIALSTTASTPTGNGSILGVYS